MIGMPRSRRRITFPNKRPAGCAKPDSAAPPSAMVAAKPAIFFPATPFDLLLPYQLAIAKDKSRFKYCLQARQTGKDFASAAEGIRDCYRHECKKSKVTWLIAAPSERQSMESLEKWKEWAVMFKIALADIEEVREDPANSQSLLKSTTITFPHGSRVIAVPGKPDTVRGFSANILLTEFAFFEDPDKTWRAILPSITNPLRGGPKKCRLVTTPNGVGNKAHAIWTGNYQRPDAKWSCHRVDIHEAVAQGLNFDIEEMRTGLDDPEGWAQEYELNFLDQSTVLLPYEVIAPCENPMATTTVPPEFWNLSTINSQLSTPPYCGVDFGRKQDLTVCWTLELVAGTFRMTREVLELARLSTTDQLEHLRPRLRRAQRACFDYTGPGTGLGDFLVKEFGEYAPEKHLYGKIELCTFTNALKVDIFPKLRMAFDQKTIGIPVNRAVREDLHSVSRVTLTGGGVTYKAPHTEDGHADRCTALALALRAAGQGSGYVGRFIAPTGKRARVLAERRNRTCQG
jgi:phage FluMu gp28-like protein